MRLRLLTASLLACALASGTALAQATLQVPVGGTGGKPMPQHPVDPKESPEEIAKDAARDLKDNRFYNKPGATRAQYDADWQECRLIARGSRTPTGTVPYYYNPAVISPMAAGIGGALGGFIAAKIAEGQQRRANRRACLLIRGWRLVEPAQADAVRVAAMSDAEKNAWFDRIVGAEKVDGKVTARTTFNVQPDPALNVDAPVTGGSSVYLGKKVDPAAPVKLGPGEGAVVIVYRRPEASSANRSAILQLARYDMKARDLVYPAKDWKKKGDKTTYAVSAPTADKKSPLEVQVLRVTAGDYVITGGAVNPGKVVVSSNCFGAPVFHVAEGEVAYLGDFIPYWDVRLSSGEKMQGLGYAMHVEDTRKALAARQPALAAALKPATLRNRATYACSAINMDRWDLPGMDALPEPEPAAAAATAG